ncbi:MAG: hypothetical protein A2373_03615 [Candidatus Magasanikbacteria bacterium RIFOXYB1_FULL_40_15]|uniref:Prepilin-type N-terminal cleavage/methylation domain-containing protein n=1 Tax=Candidatus Magasanikbacteria bacterium RIFOXYB1_FULL_40_15 TaxID=1798697 RepID=A0A1F6NJ11_9BACT|nr:MAG: hypothetical protein A2373_03615 [Candidatus Magasanikbacteria bacterium RIFOXYB1_FULL_40_15]
MFKYLNKKGFIQHHFFWEKNGAGFSLIEILLVVATIMILATAGLISYRSFQKRLELSTSVSDVIATLQLAAEKTISSEDNEQYGVHFETGFYALFKGFDWNPLDPENEITYFPTSVEYTDIWEGTSDTIAFDRLTGTTGHTEDVILRLADDHSESRTIKILPSGRVGLEGTIELTDTREVDSRHTHFDLGWSLQGSSDLELHFDGTVDVDEVITMADYFDAGETVFDWSGTVVVDGESQVVRIHTHSLDEFDTVLCIHRDGRYNTKALDVSVDGKDIVSFTADGVATVAVFGGDMTAQ